LQLRPISVAYFLEGLDLVSAWRELELSPVRVYLEMFIYTSLNLLCLLSTLSQSQYTLHNMISNAAV